MSNHYENFVISRLSIHGVTKADHFLATNACETEAEIYKAYTDLF